MFVNNLAPHAVAIRCLNEYLGSLQPADPAPKALSLIICQPCGAFGVWRRVRYSKVRQVP